MSVAAAETVTLDRSLGELTFPCQDSVILERGLGTKEATWTGGAGRREMSTKVLSRRM